MKFPSCLTLIAVAGVAGAAAAQDLEERLLDCAGLGQQQARLACYDALAAALAPATGESPEDRSPAQFGLEHKTPEPVSAIRASLVKIGKTPLGKMLLTLDNGQTWQQKDSKRLILHAGDEVLIERGALSAFYLSAGNNKRIQVARVR